ncbi:hypothetical protein OBV_p-00660 (plasmid) [Oscillibacter valericigenes Sjm18-20]|nr:hypothetical protein OBV_p-00660 [Oscillibacter valericigenes Sjm18-20]
MIDSGVKLEEYRELSPYYKSRFKNLFEMHPGSFAPCGRDKKKIWLRNGYSAARPTLEVTCTLTIRTGNPDWGAVPGKKYYVLEILDKKRIV